MIEECDADTAAVDFDGYTAWDCACKRESLDLVKYFVEDIGTDIQLRTKNGSMSGSITCGKVLKYLTNECNIDVHEPNFEGNTPFMYAAATGRLEDVKHLIEECLVEVNVTNKKKQTPLHRAIRFYRYVDIRIVKYLIESCRIDVSAVDAEGKSAMHVACKYKASDESLLKCLVQECGADMTLRDHIGQTPMHLVCCDGNLDLIYYLLRHDGFFSASVALKTDSITPRPELTKENSLPKFPRPQANKRESPETKTLKLIPVSTWHMDN